MPFCSMTMRRLLHTNTILYFQLLILAACALHYAHGDSNENARTSQRTLQLNVERSQLTASKMLAASDSLRVQGGLSHQYIESTMLLQSKLAQSKQLKSKPDDILGSDSQSPDDESGGGAASDSYGKSSS